MIAVKYHINTDTLKWLIKTWQDHAAIKTEKGKYLKQSLSRGRYHVLVSLLSKYWYLIKISLILWNMKKSLVQSQWGIVYNNKNN